MNFNEMPHLERTHEAPVPTSGPSSTNMEGALPGKFEQFVTLNQPMTVKEAVDVLGKFHEASEQSVLNAFLNLRNAINKEGHTAEFSMTAQKGAPIMKVEVRDASGQWVSNSLIDQYSGQPVMHIS